MAAYPALPFWVRDYIADTRHLTLEQRGAYTDLLFFCWVAPECKIPDDDKIIAQTLGITKARWVSKIAPAVRPLFDQQDSFLLQKRLLSERNSVQKRVEAARENGSKGGRPQSKEIKDLAKPEGSDPVKPNETQEKANQKHNQNTPSKPPKGGARRGSRLPDDFMPNSDLIGWAKEKTPDVDLQWATDAFKDYWKSATGRTATKLDWNAAWRSWMRREQERKGGRGGPAKRPRLGL